MSKMFPLENSNAHVWVKTTRKKKDKIILLKSSGGKSRFKEICKLSRVETLGKKTPSKGVKPERDGDQGGVTL